MGTLIERIQAHTLNCMRAEAGRKSPLAVRTLAAQRSIECKDQDRSR
jgi:hypothetical protein